MDSTFLDLTSSQPRVTKPNLNLFDTSGFSYNDFELLHHWTISTAESLTLNKVLQQAIREVIPRLAIAYNYLMYVSVFSCWSFLI
jgi:hypothetical protein